MYRMILVPCLISCPANSPCPAMRDGPTRTRIFTSGCLLVDAEVLPVLSLLDSTAPNIGVPLGRCTAFPKGKWTPSGTASQQVTVAPSDFRWPLKCCNFNTLYFGLS